MWPCNSSTSNYAEESESHFNKAVTTAAPPASPSSGCRHKLQTLLLDSCFHPPAPSTTYLQVIRLLAVEMHIKLRTNKQKTTSFFIPGPIFEIWCLKMLHSQPHFRGHRDLEMLRDGLEMLSRNSMRTHVLMRVSARQTRGRAHCGQVQADQKWSNWCIFAYLLVNWYYSE